ncbi:MAG: hypothetical protein H7Y02_06815 [Candidatus Obscuribacterales bacterium]|nr:hypothetical protein [Steroidobacteraceae bacterium]
MSIALAEQEVRHPDLFVVRRNVNKWLPTSALDKEYSARACTCPMREFAERLLAFESERPKSFGHVAPIAVLISEKLRPQLASLMGNGGFRAMVSRAVSLAQVEAPALRSVRVTAETSLEGWEEIAAQATANETFNSSVELLAQLLGLLVVFIGENLTLRLVGELWPTVSLNDLHFGKEDDV